MLDIVSMHSLFRVWWHASTEIFKMMQYGAFRSMF